MKKYLEDQAQGIVRQQPDVKSITPIESMKFKLKHFFFYFYYFFLELETPKVILAPLPRPRITPKTTG